MRQQQHAVFVHGGQSGQGHTEGEVQNLPEGFRIIVTAFQLEDAFANEGWSGLGNLGDDGVARVIDACERLGLQERARALARTYAVFRQNQEDDRALKKAAGGTLPDLVDDDQAFQVIATFVRTDQEERYGTLPDDA